MYTIILAAQRREAVDWARQNEVPFRNVRFAQDANSIPGTFYDRIVELPSYGKRRDRFSVQAAIKRLKRRLPNIEHTVLDEFVMSPPAPAPTKVSNLTWLLGDVGAQDPFSNALPYDKGGILPSGLTTMTNDTGETITVNPLVQPGEAPVLDRKDMDLNLSAEELREVGASEDEIKQHENILELQAKIQGDQAAVTPEVTAAVTSEAPKRKGRRTNEQKAYDEARTAFEAEPDSIELAGALDATYAALLERHPDDERVLAVKASAAKVAAALPKLPKPESTPGVAQGAPDLDF